MANLSPTVLLIVLVAVLFIFFRVAKKLFLYFLILFILEMVILIIWPESLQALIKVVSTARAIIFK